MFRLTRFFRNNGFAADDGGFTLLEVMIALALMVVSFAAILSIQSNSISVTEKARNMNIATMLAKRAMVEAELELKGKTFREVKEEDGSNFEAPYQDFRWTRTIKEIEFPSLNFASPGGGEEDGSGQNSQVEQLAQLIQKFFTDSIRELTVTVYWPRGDGEQRFTLSTYWVDLNHEFSLTP